MSAICYFSKKCRFCQAFLEELAKTPYMRDVKFFCVDPSPTRPPLPGWLKSVPTLEVQGESKPRVGPSEVNNWLFERRLTQGKKVEERSDAFEERNAPLKMPTYSPDLAPRATPAPKQSAPGPKTMTPATVSSSDEPMAWHCAEMSGGSWSDSYSFLDGDSVDTGHIMHNFELLQDPTASATHSGSQSKSTAKPSQPRSAKEEKLLSEFEAYAKSREMEFSSTKRIG